MRVFGCGSDMHPGPKMLPRENVSWQVTTCGPRSDETDQQGGPRVAAASISLT